MRANSEVTLSNVDRPFQEIYAREPLEYREGVPIFSKSDWYTKNYEKISADHLSSLFQSGENPFIKEELWVELEDSTARLVTKYAKSGDTILDVGVGLGRLLSRFPTLQRYGMDISMSYLGIAKSKGINVCLADIEDMPYKIKLFDIVVCTDVLEHVIDLNYCLRNILDVLKAGGILIARVPYREDLSSYLQPDYPYEFAHLRNFDEHSLTLLFQRIFSRTKLLEWVTVGYVLGTSRLKYRLPFGELTFVRIVRRVRLLSSALFKALVPRLFLPVEINVAVRKQ